MARAPAAKAGGPGFDFRWLFWGLFFLFKLAYQNFESVSCVVLSHLALELLPHLHTAHPLQKQQLLDIVAWAQAMINHGVANSAYPKPSLSL